MPCHLFDVQMLFFSVNLLRHLCMPFLCPEIFLHCPLQTLLLVNSFSSFGAHSFIQQIFTEHLLYINLNSCHAYLMLLLNTILLVISWTYLLFLISLGWFTSYFLLGMPFLKVTDCLSQGSDSCFLALSPVFLFATPQFRTKLLSCINHKMGSNLSIKFPWNNGSYDNNQTNS